MPKWLKDAIFYEIYPQSFCDTNADGIGDLQGIIRKLDYVKELGCNALWLNPCFDSPFNDAGYDVRDYMKIAPRYGTNEDMRELLQKAHERGIHVILDLVPGHTAITHEWFVRSMQSDKKLAGRYIWSETPWERFENIPGIMGSISGICQRGSCAVNFYSTQPALNYGFVDPDPEKPWQIHFNSEDALATRAAMVEVMRFWLDMGCDGFRVDMAFSLIKNDKDHIQTKKLWQEIRAMFDSEYPEAVLISEWGNPRSSLAAGFHMDFLLHFGESKYNSLFRGDDPYFSKNGRNDLAEFIDDYTGMLRDVEALTVGLKSPSKALADGLICFPSSNHDMTRIARLLDADELKLAFAFLLTMPGAPFIYYGDEIGMRYLEDMPSVEGGYERTGSRSPMQWDNSLNAGFSSGKVEDLYIPLDTAPDRPDAGSQMADKDSLWHEVKKLNALRMSNKALQNLSPVEFLSSGDKRKGSPLAYKRGSGKGSVVVVLNPSLDTASIEVKGSGKMRVLYSVGMASKVDKDKVNVPPCSGLFLTQV